MGRAFVWAADRRTAFGVETGIDAYTPIIPLDRSAEYLERAQYTYTSPTLCSRAGVEERDLGEHERYQYHEDFSDR